MSLPSQSARLGGIGRSNMYRKRRGPRRLAVIGGGIALVVVIGGWLLFRGGSEADGVLQAETTGAAPSSSGVLGPQSATASPTTTARVRTPQPAEPVVELRQGRAESPVVATSPGRPSAPAPAATEAEREPEEEPDTLYMRAPVEAEPEPAEEKPEPFRESRPVAPETTRTPAPASPSLSTTPGSTLAAAHQKLAEGDLVVARVLFSRALAVSRSEDERAMIRAELTKINDDLVFSPRIADDDPFAYSYTIAPNDSLVRINQRQGLAPDWRLIQRINRISHPNRIQVGQRLKLLRGPFHAVVHKSAFRLDVYMGPADNQDEWLYIRSFPVGLGEDGSTPTGTFVVRRNSKLIDPHWVNPRTGEHFASGDPENPIGRRWIGLEGIGESSGYMGYGLHGTIEPESVGREESMGCVRLLDDDIELLYKLLGEQVSVVHIRP